MTLSADNADRPGYLATARTRGVVGCTSDDGAERPAVFQARRRSVVPVRPAYEMCVDDALPAAMPMARSVPSDCRRSISKPRTWSCGSQVMVTPVGSPIALRRTGATG